jgi:hypothetical protein
MSKKPDPIDAAAVALGATLIAQAAGDVPKARRAAHQAARWIASVDPTYKPEAHDEGLDELVEGLAKERELLLADVERLQHRQREHDSARVVYQAEAKRVVDLERILDETCKALGTGNRTKAAIVAQTVVDEERKHRRRVDELCDALGNVRADELVDAVQCIVSERDAFKLRAEDLRRDAEVRSELGLPAPRRVAVVEQVEVEVEQVKVEQVESAVDDELARRRQEYRDRMAAERSKRDARVEQVDASKWPADVVDVVEVVEVVERITERSAAPEQNATRSGSKAKPRAKAVERKVVEQVVEVEQAKPTSDDEFAHLPPTMRAWAKANAARLAAASTSASDID